MRHDLHVHWSKGYLAALYGYQPSDNPYRPSMSQRFNLWRDGFQYAKEQHKGHTK